MKRKEPVNPLALMLPEDVYKYFELVEALCGEKDIQLFLDEKPLPPDDEAARYQSKGFTEQAIIQDFPMRGKPVFLHIRRRKWLDLRTQRVITSSYDLSHLGTQINKEFAAFLKGISRE